MFLSPTRSAVSCLQSLLSILAMYRKVVVPDQRIKVSTQKKEADLTDEQRKKGGINFGKIRRNEECNSKFARCVEEST